jgi:hypothetical protein
MDTMTVSFIFVFQNIWFLPFSELPSICYSLKCAKYGIPLTQVLGFKA